MRISVTIMAYRAREAYELRDSLDHPARIVFGDGDDEWKVGRKAWELHDDYADYHMVLRDGAIAVPDLVASVAQALKVLGPLGLFSPFTRRPRPTDTDLMMALDRARLGGYSWVGTTSMVSGVALCAPVSSISELLAWADGCPPQLPYQERVGRFYRDILGWRFWSPYPSLVDHRVELGRKHEGVAVAMGDKVDWALKPPGFDHLVDREMWRFAR